MIIKSKWGIVRNHRLTGKLYASRKRAGAGAVEFIPVGDYHRENVAARLDAAGLQVAAATLRETGYMEDALLDVVFPAQRATV